MIGGSPIAGAPIAAGLTTGASSAGADTTFRQPLVTRVERRRSAGFVEVGQSLLLTTLAVAVAAAPFKQTDWPNPAKRPAAQQPSFVRVNTATVAPPFIVEDMSNPVVRKSAFQHDVGDSRLLYRQNGAPFQQGDWPNPVRAKPPTPDVGARAVQAPTAAPPFVGGPDANPAIRRAAPQHEVGDSQLLYRQNGAPFASIDLPNPHVRKFYGHDAGSQAVQVPVTVAAPFVQSEWGIPWKRPAAQQPSFIRVNTTTYAAPFPAQDFPNPHARKPYGHDVGSQAVQVPVAVVAPFVQSEWANPTTRKPAAQQPYYFRPDVTPVGPASGAPFVPIDFPNPHVRKKLSGQDIEVIAFPNAFTPIVQSDWPNPVVRKTAQADPGRSAIQNLSAVIAPLPPGSASFPEPFKRREAQQPTFIRVDGSGAAPASGSPFVPVDFPNPYVRKKFSGQEIDTAALLNAYTPIVQSDWPNPVVRKITPTDPGRSALVNLTFVPSPAPFAQRDWPNPNPRRAARQEPGMVALWNLLQKVPPGQAEFVNPPRRRAANQDPGRSALVNLTFVPPPPPFKQLEWPNPYKRPSWKGLQTDIPVAVSPYFILAPVNVTVTGVSATGVVGDVNIWSTIDDSQAGAWTPVDDAQSGSWTAVDASQAGTWSPVDDSQTNLWSPVDDSQDDDWWPVTPP